jgi:hypothetical protein
MDRPPQNPPPPGTRLMDQLREQLRYAHYSLRTEAAYLHWVRASAPTTGATPVSWRSLLDNLAGAAPLAPPPPVQPPPLCYLAAARTPPHHRPHHRAHRS